MLRMRTRIQSRCTMEVYYKVYYRPRRSTMEVYYRVLKMLRMRTRMKKRCTMKVYYEGVLSANSTPS